MNLQEEIWSRGVGKIFQREGHTCVKVRENSGHFNINNGQDIVIVFSPLILDCLLKKGLQKGGGASGVP